jgi:hypothetical protein
MRITLETLTGASAGKRIVLESGQVVRVGRTGRAEVVFAEDAHMSGMHFALEWGAEGLVIRDLGSSNGTLVNGQRVEHAALAHGDRIRAGDTEFSVQMEAGTAGEETPSPRGALPLPAGRPETASGGTATALTTQSAAPSLLDAPWLPPLTPVTSRLLRALRQEFQPLYALLDAARDPLVLAILFESKQEYQSLYEGTEGEKLSAVAPYLVRLPNDSPLLEVLARAAWGKSWGVFLTSDSPFTDIRRHLRYFLMVKLPEGKQVYFRFYDPRVLRVYLPTCTADETRTFFGPIKCFLVEGDKPEAALRFAPGAQGVEQAVGLLASKPGRGPTGTLVA